MKKAGALGTIRAISTVSHSVGRQEGGDMLIRLQSTQLQTIKINNVTVETTQRRLSGLCEGLYIINCINFLASIAALS